MRLLEGLEVAFISAIFVTSETARSKLFRVLVSVA